MKGLAPYPRAPSRILTHLAHPDPLTQPRASSPPRDPSLPPHAFFPPPVPLSPRLIISETYVER